ncbi:AAA family ATPase [Hymenobacter aranciens]
MEPDLNVLVGINGSGKSNFLRAFQLLKAGMEGRLREQVAQWGGIDSIRQKNLIRPQSHREIVLEFTVAGAAIGRWDDGYEGDIIYGFYLSGGTAGEFRLDESIKRPDEKVYLDSYGSHSFYSSKAKEVTGSEKRYDLGQKGELSLPAFTPMDMFGNFTRLFYLLELFDIYRLFNTTEDAPMRTTVRATGVDKLLPNGDNMFQVLNTTGLKSTAAYDAIEAGLHDVNEHFQRFRMNVYGQGSVEFYLQEKGLETPIHAAQVSDGTLSYLCLLVALHQPGRGRVVIFDEPERNLHPDMLLELGKQLEKAGESCQLLVTTHAPGLLNQFPLRAVRVFEKDEHNQTQVRQFTEADFAGWYDTFAPGQMWRDGALGGNRY